MQGNAATPRQVHIVTKSEVGIDAPYLIGAFPDIGEARAACRRIGTYTIHSVDVGRDYRQGEMLDVEQVIIVSRASLNTLPPQG